MTKKRNESLLFEVTPILKPRTAKNKLWFVPLLVWDDSRHESGFNIKHDDTKMVKSDVHKYTYFSYNWVQVLRAFGGEPKGGSEANPTGGSEESKALREPKPIAKRP